MDKHFRWFKRFGDEECVKPRIRPNFQGLEHILNDTCTRGDTSRTSMQILTVKVF